LLTLGVWRLNALLRAGEVGLRLLAIGAGPEVPIVVADPNAVVPGTNLKA
jgi:hypothetical protein